MLGINADGTFSAGGEAGMWSRPENNRIKFDKNTQLPGAYEWSYAIHDGHLVIAPFHRSDTGTVLAGSTWQTYMKDWNSEGSSALIERSRSVSLNADGTATYRWSYSVGDMHFPTTEEGTWTETSASSFTLTLDQHSDTFAVSGTQAFPASATYSRVCD